VLISMFLLGLLLAGASCYRNATVTPVAAQREARFENILEAAYAGDTGPWRVDGRLVESLGGGAIRVVPDEHWDARVPVRGISNAWLSTKVKSRLAADPEIEALSVNVYTDENGLVSLRGQVPDSHMAARAIEDALTTIGVNAVDSYLTW